jgi:hypothetical protein
MTIGVKLILGAAILSLTPDVCPAQQKSTNWVLGYDKDAQEELGLKTAPRIASVRAKGGRKSSLVLEKCKNNFIEGRFDDDPAINVEKLAGNSDTKTIYLSYDGVSSAPTAAGGGYAPWYISIPMPPATATTINLCPTPEATGSRCLRFPIEGFSKARQFICPGR